jgi:hypothetical protein
VPENISGQHRREFLRVLAGLGMLATSASAARSPQVDYDLKLDDTFILNEYARRSFRYFVEQSNDSTGLILDRAGADGTVPNNPVSSIAATGFGLTAFCIGAERGWISTEEARDRTLKLLRFLRREAPHIHGFYLHFMNPATAEPRFNSEFSSIDTAILLGGVLIVAQYFANDSEIPILAKQIYDRVDF